MPAAAAVALIMVAPQVQAALAAVVQAVITHHPAQERLAPQIQAVAVAVVAHLQILLQLLAQAAPASSSSNTPSPSNLS